MPKRYDHLLTLIDNTKPRTITEVGVHLGLRAREMCLRAQQYHDSIDYQGYDLWEWLEDHEEVHNGKGPSTKKAVEERLSRLKREHCPGLHYTLTQGDTTQTLPHEHQRDLVFIDADHRTESIQRDLERCRGSRVIVLDDYYWPPKEGLGCNLCHLEGYLEQVIETSDQERFHRHQVWLKVLTLCS